MLRNQTEHHLKNKANKQKNEICMKLSICLKGRIVPVVRRLRTKDFIRYATYIFLVLLQVRCILSHVLLSYHLHHFL